MALDAAVFSQELFAYTCKELLAIGGAWNEFGVVEDENMINNEVGERQEQWSGWMDELSSIVEQNSPSPEICKKEEYFFNETSASRHRQRRARSYKNKEELENQRMTHIAVERNRRKLMNEYLAVLRSLMPPSYVQRGDQASVIGGAINYVKELEQLLQALEAQKYINQCSSSNCTTSPFTDFFTFPQYSSSTSSSSSQDLLEETKKKKKTSSAMADIQVTMVENHASLKVLSRTRPKQLLKMVTGLHSLHLTIFHLNLTTFDHMTFYSFSLKVEEECPAASADEIAGVVHEMLGRIEEEQLNF
ncbi:putative transcription factor bHLH family [Dioscorea sansibarensis]